MRRNPLALTTLAFLLAVGAAEAQTLKIGYINSQEILANAPGAEEAGQQFDDEQEAMGQEIQALEADIDLLVEGTPKYEEALKKYLGAAADLRAWVEFKGRKLDAKRAQRRTQVYDEIVLAATEFAEQNNIDFILTDDSILELRPGTDGQVVQQMSLRRVVYANPEFDITDELIEWINQK